jgi:hypothetical protein
MEFNWFEILAQVAGILAAVIGGFGAVPAVNWLKGVLKLEGGAALVLTVLFAVVWGVAEMIVGGQITQDSFTLANLAALVTAVFAVSQARYNMLKGGA